MTAKRLVNDGWLFGYLLPDKNGVKDLEVVWCKEDELLEFAKRDTRETNCAIVLFKVIGEILPSTITRMVG